MDRNIDIYCEFGFFEKFANLCPLLKNGIPTDNYKYWQNYLDLLCGNTDIVLTDIEKIDFISQCDDSMQGQILQIILDSHADGLGNLVCIPAEKRNMETFEQEDEGHMYFQDHEQTIFLLDRNKEECKFREENYGLMFISPETLYDQAKLLFLPQRKEINSGVSGWNFMENYKHPCKTIHLIDNYILSKDIKDLEKNINSLFDALLPPKLKYSFKVNISTETPQNQDEAWVDRRVEKVKSWIRELRKDSYDIDVVVNFRQSNNHDRNLFTNYYLFDCGYGFILSDRERSIGTNLTVFPITHSSTLPIMQTLKKRFLN